MEIVEQIRRARGLHTYIYDVPRMYMGSPTDNAEEGDRVRLLSFPLTRRYHTDTWWMERMTRNDAALIGVLNRSAWRRRRGMDVCEADSILHVVLFLPREVDGDSIPRLDMYVLVKNDILISSATCNLDRLCI